MNLKLPRTNFIIALLIAITLFVGNAQHLKAQAGAVGYPSTVTYTATSASTGTVNLCATCPPGLYQVTGYATVTTGASGTSPNLISTLAWTDHAAARTTSLLGTLNTSTTNTAQGTALVYLFANGAITISGALSGTTSIVLDEVYTLDRIR